MIAANELRIGNLVNGGYDRLVEVQSICSLDGDIFNDQTGEIPLDSVKGIPLTEDWFLKFGFEKWVDRPCVGYTSWRIGEDMIIEFEALTLEDEYPFYQFGHQQLKYVHHLQNLYFALLKKELILNE